MKQPLLVFQLSLIRKHKSISMFTNSLHPSTVVINRLCLCVGREVFTVCHPRPRTRHTGSPLRQSVPDKCCCRRDRALPVSTECQWSTSRSTRCLPSQYWGRKNTYINKPRTANTTIILLLFLTCWWRRRWRGRPGRGSLWRRSGWTGLGCSYAVGKN